MIGCPTPTHPSLCSSELDKGTDYEVVTEDRKESIEVAVGQKRKNMEEETSDAKRHKEQTSNDILL